VSEIGDESGQVSVGATDSRLYMTTQESAIYLSVLKRASLIRANKSEIIALEPDLRPARRRSASTTFIGIQSLAELLSLIIVRG